VGVVFSVQVARASQIRVAAARCLVRRVVAAECGVVKAGVQCWVKVCVKWLGVAAGRNGAANAGRQRSR